MLGPGLVLDKTVNKADGGVAFSILENKEDPGQDVPEASGKMEDFALLPPLGLSFLVSL